ncbi:MAG: ATPase domain-containing protein [Steroidobacteraceae bacterium]
MTTNKVDIRQVKTGVTGLDDVLGGGLPQFSFNLIAGPPGAGKTTLAHQLMFNLATPDNQALYFTVLGEPPLKMLRYQQQFDYFEQDKINRCIRFISLTEETASGDLGRVLELIAAQVAIHSPAFVFVDSFRSVILAARPEARVPLTVQEFTQQLGTLMTSWQATTFLLGEYDSHSEADPIFTIADGIIWLRQSVERNSVIRKLEIMKMRGQATTTGLHTFRITGHGLSVFSLPPYATSNQGDGSITERLKMGVPMLDEMLGGGLPRGYSLLVAGPSGSGKSILASAFLIQGTREGETGVIVAFEQRPNKSRGSAIFDLIQKGRIGVVDTRAPGVSVDEIAALIIAEVRRLKAGRLVIDSLSGFELALAPTFREDFRESLARMVAALANTGVTTLMTSELEDRYTELRFSPYGTAFLTDAIIVQRYIEVDSSLRRVLGVIKVRASAHSNELRQFSIDAGGIRIGAMLGNHEGLLSGTPTSVHEPAA